MVSAVPLKSSLIQFFLIFSSSCLLLACGESRKQNGGGFSSNQTPKVFGNTDQDTVKDKVQEFDQEIVQGTTDKPEPIVTHADNYQSMIFVEENEELLFEIPDDYSCAEDGDWSLSGPFSPPSTDTASTKCQLRLVVDENNFEPGNEIGQVYFVGKVLNASGNQVNLSYMVKAIMAYPTEAPMETQAPEPPSSIEVLDPMDIETGNEPGDEVNTSAVNLKVLAGDSKAIPLGEISAVTNPEAEENSVMLTLPDEVILPLKWQYSLPSINGTWLSGQPISAYCSINHNVNTYGEPDEKNQLNITDDLAAEAFAEKCPIKPRINFETSRVELELQLVEFESVPGRYYIDGLDQYNFKDGKNNILLFEMIVPYQENGETAQRTYSLQFPLRLNIIRQKTAELTNYELLGSFRDSVYYVSRGALARTQLATGIQLAKTAFGSQYSVNTVIMDGPEENEFVSSRVSHRNGRRLYFWLGITDEITEGNWLKYFDGIDADQESVEFTNWNSGEPNNRRNEDCATGNWRRDTRYVWNDLNCNRARLKHVIEVQANGSFDLPIGEINPD